MRITAPIARTQAPPPVDPGRAAESGIGADGV